MISNTALAPIPTRAPARNVSKPHVLAIEDNADFVQILRHLIEAMGYELTASATGREGLDIAQQLKPDIIFCDLGLPGGMDGFEFARRVRLDEALKDTPMIAVTARTDDSSRQKALGCGFDKIFLKPVRFADLRDAMTAFSSQGGRRDPDR
ncbi:hypothetical protein BH11PSE11_BH11PSE11_24180 [soil metagenome]